MVTNVQQLVDLLGGHPIRVLGIDLDTETGLGRWLVAACLLAGRAGEEKARRALEALDAAGLGAPAQLAGADPMSVAFRLADAGYPRPEVAAQRIHRASRALVERWGGSIEALASEAGDLEDLGGRVAGLAPGVGRTTTLLFLRPLRDRFAAARETPLAPAAVAAARHLGWIRADADGEGEPGALRARLAEEDPAPALADVEAALERLGRRACLREDPRRCPLGAACPARRGGVAGPASRE